MMIASVDKIVVDREEASASTFTASRLAISLLIGISIVLVTVLHFLTPVERVVWHEIYQRLYYLPIIAAALLFGLRGGITASLFTTVVYFPHIFIHADEGHFDYSINQFAEIVIFIVVGTVMGALGDRLKSARERAERNAEQRRRAYEELQATFEQLLQAEKLAALGELAAGIVHEVRNPLASIKGAIEILESRSTKSSDRREFSELAKSEVDRLDRLVAEFLRFAKPAPLSIQENDLNQVVRSFMPFIETQAAAQGVVLDVVLDKDLPPCLMDREHIRQVLLNLSINALQQMLSVGKLVFRSYRNHGYSCVEVEDTGGGVQPEILDRIFDPFFTTRAKGVGLGLSVAHKIIRQHNGQLRVRNGNLGAVFVIELPIAKGRVAGSS